MLYLYQAALLHLIVTSTATWLSKAWQVSVNFWHKREEMKRWSHFTVLLLNTAQGAEVGAKLSVAASENDPASATAVGCFACSGSAESLETHLHSWFHITSGDVPPSSSVSPSPVSLLLLRRVGGAPRARGQKWSGGA